MTANVQNALMFSKGKKCRICSGNIHNNNKSGFCNSCYKKDKTGVERVREFDRATCDGQESLIFPPSDIIEE